MTSVLNIPTPALISADRLPWLTGRPAIFMLDACLPPAFCTKVRSVSSLAYHAARNALPASSSTSGEPAASRDRLRAAFADATLIAASTGSHARAVAELANWLRSECRCRIEVEILLTADAPANKVTALRKSGARVRVGGDFTDLTAQARRIEAARLKRGEKAIYLPTDPLEENSPSGLFRLSDGVYGFASVLADLVEGLRLRGELHPGAMPDPDTLVIPTSGGATWSACLALAAQARPAPGRSGGREGPIRVVAAGSTTARPVFRSLAGGVLETDCPIDRSATGINGLDQRDMSPWAFATAGRLVVDPRREVLHTSCSGARVAQLITHAETGVLPEPAGAAALGAELEERLAAGGRAFLSRLGLLLRAYGYEPHQFRRQMALDPRSAWPTGRIEQVARVMAGLSPRLALAEITAASPAPSYASGGGTVFLVTGAWVRQRPTVAASLILAELRRGGGGSVRLGDILAALAYACCRAAPGSVAATRERLTLNGRERAMLDAALCEKRFGGSGGERLRLAWTRKTLSKHGLLP